MTYVISDIHGEADRFHELLRRLPFGDDDSMYIIGDVIDRGSEGVDLLLEIMDKPNMHMLLGNHEQMLLDTLGCNSYPGARQLWAQNGGNVTRRELLYHRTTAERHGIIKFLEGLPDELTICVRGRSFYLVHGRPARHHDDRIWGRVKPSDNCLSDQTVIVGHTPTPFLTMNHKEPFMIYHGDGWIDIDCGCGNLMSPYRRLACLRLDDMEEFYV